MKNTTTAKAETVINTTADKVWDALTKPEIIKQYFFNTNTYTTWQPGSPIRFTGEWEGKSYEDKGTILEVEQEKLIKYNYWSSMSGIEDKPENYVTITYNIHAEGGKTKLTITQENIADEKMKEHSEENWRKVLASLKELLENETVDHVESEE